MITSAALTSRERVLRSLSGQDIDRLPVLFRAEPETIKIFQSYFKTDQLDRYFRADLVRAYINESKSFALPPLAGIDNVGQVDNLPWPNRGYIDLSASLEAARRAHASGRAVCGGIWASLFTSSRRAMGEEKYCVEMCLNPDLISRIVDRFTEACLDINEAYFGACAKYLDIFYFGSDFGAQQSMFISPDHYRKFFKQNMKRLCDQAGKFGLKAMYHSCGSIVDIIPDLIEIGVDILDPIQVSAANMGPGNLASRFKGKIAFHGAISTQQLLPVATPEVVREEVHKTIAALGPLGFIAGPDQNITEDTPPENVAAMYEAIHSYKL